MSEDELLHYMMARLDKIEAKIDSLMDLRSRVLVLATVASTLISLAVALYLKR